MYGTSPVTSVLFPTVSPVRLTVLDIAYMLNKHLRKGSLANKPAEVVLPLRPIKFLNASFWMFSKVWPHSAQFAGKFYLSVCSLAVKPRMLLVGLHGFLIFSCTPVESQLVYIFAEEPGHL